MRLPAVNSLRHEPADMTYLLVNTESSGLIALCLNGSS